MIVLHNSTHACLGGFFGTGLSAQEIRVRLEAFAPAVLRQSYLITPPINVS